MDLKVRKHIYFYGRVQGVGFRYYAVQKAGQLGLAGWVRNRYDGSVEMEVEGAETDIDQMILFLQNRTYIWIEDMRVKSMPLEGEYARIYAFSINSVHREACYWEQSEQ